MGLNLEHFKVAEDPSSLYRRVGMPAVEDFLNKGYIQGTDKYGKRAYFLQGGEWSTGGAPYRIEVNPRLLQPVNNPLYGDINLNRYLTVEGAFPLKGNNYNYPTLTPNPDPKFLDVVNPSNRKGIKVIDTRTGDVIYDRTKPLTKTPLSTTIKNLKTDAKILLKTPLPAVATKTIGALGGALSMAGQVYGATRDNVYDREYGMSDPFSVRPMWELLINGSEAQKKLVADPEWQVRNPYTAPIYNLIHGNTEPMEAFVEGYKPYFTESK